MYCEHIEKHTLYNLNNDLLRQCLKYLCLKDKYYYLTHFITKQITEEIFEEVKKEVFNNPIYMKVMCHYKVPCYNNMHMYPMVFFELKYFRNNFRDFKKYLFHYCSLIKSNLFFLVSRLEKVYFVQKINDNSCILLFYHDNNIYYNVFYQKIPFHAKDEITKRQNGYIYYDGVIIQEHREVIDIILEANKPQIEL